MRRTLIAGIGIVVLAVATLLFAFKNDDAKIEYGDADQFEYSRTYIDLLDWPPQVNYYDEPYSCTEAGTETERAGKTEERTINGREYCVTTLVEGAAGSIYTQYAYATGDENKTIVATWSTRVPQCLNYDEPQRGECEGEVNNFNPDELASGFIDEL